VDDRLDDGIDDLAAVHRPHSRLDIFSGMPSKQPKVDASCFFVVTVVTSDYACAASVSVDVSVDART
jgi:hypothetical protein